MEESHSSRMSIFTIVLAIIGASQFYWAWRALPLARKWIPQPGRRRIVLAAVLAIYLALWYYNFGAFFRPTPTHLTFSYAVLAAPFLTWAVSSLVGALIALVFAIPQAMVGLARWIWAKWRARSGGEVLPSPSRRVFLERTAKVAAAASSMTRRC